MQCVSAFAAMKVSSKGEWVSCNGKAGPGAPLCGDRPCDNPCGDLYCRNTDWPPLADGSPAPCVLASDSDPPMAVVPGAACALGGGVGMCGDGGGPCESRGPGWARHKISQRAFSRIVELRVGRAQTRTGP